MHFNSDSKSSSALSEFFFGLTAPFAALKLMFRHPKLILLSILPVLITVGILSGLVFLVLSGIAPWVTAHLGTYFGLAAQVLVTLILIFTAFQLMLLVIETVSTPFNDWLAEHTEKVLGVTPPSRPGFGYYFRVIRMDLGKSILNLVMMVAFTMGTWVPVAGLVFLVGIAFLNTLNYISYPQSRRLIGIRQSFDWLKRNGSRSLGFGIATTILFGIPVINFFAIPLSVVGGTLIYLKNSHTGPVSGF